MAARGLLLSLTIVLLVAVTARGQVVEETDSETVTSNKAVAEGATAELSPQAAQLIVEQTNAFRQSESREPVAANAELEAAAQYFAQYMAKTDTYGHAADGNRPAGRATRFGYEYCLVSENIAYQYSSLGFKAEELATRLTTGWKQSPGHRKNMLEPAVTEAGVAVAQSPATRYWYAVQMFGRPKSLAVEFTITNSSEAMVSYTIGERKFPLPPRYSRTHTRCRESQVELEAAGEAALDKTVTPEDGERFVITGEGAGHSIRQE